MREKIPYSHAMLSRLKAEVIAAEILNKGVSFDEMTISLLGSFRKSYRSDVGEFNVYLNDNTNKSEFDIFINRDSIYDRLPEGLFHQSRGNTNTSSISEIIGEHRRYKEEERQARRFFQPFEQEIFKFATLIEQREQELAFDMLDGDLRNELSNFWNITKELPKSMATLLLRIMPWVYSIKGNLDLTCQALGVMLGKRVSAIQTYLSQEQKGGTISSLSQASLGVDTLTGLSVMDTSINWIFTIHDLSKKEVALYPENNVYGKFLKQFEEIFIPLSVDAIFDYAIKEKDENESENVLGFSLIL